MKTKTILLLFIINATQAVFGQAYIPFIGKDKLLVRISIGFIISMMVVNLLQNTKVILSYILELIHSLITSIILSYSELKPKNIVILFCTIVV